MDLHHLKVNIFSGSQHIKQDIFFVTWIATAKKKGSVRLRSKLMIRICLIALFFFLFSCDGGGKEDFPYEHEGLYWSDISDGCMTWDDANTYCSNMNGRLPTISELRSLIQNCPNTETGGDCSVTDDCRSIEDCLNAEAWICGGCTKDISGKYSVFGDIDLLWSSTEEPQRDDIAWGVYFEYGEVVSYYKSTEPQVRCVKEKP